MKVCSRCRQQPFTPDLFHYDEETQTFGIRADMCYWCAAKELSIIRQGYTQFIHEVNGHTFGASGLCISVKIYGRKAIVAAVHPDNMSYAYVLDDHGVWTCGCFKLFENGEFSLS